MLVFLRENLVFLAVPKTGTTAWHDALRPRADVVLANPPELKHAPLFRYQRFLRPMFETACNARPETLAVIREPVAWLGSWYRYRQRPFLKGKANSTEGISFDAFVHAHTKGKPPAFANVGSQARFLRPHASGEPVTHLFRYEDQTGLGEFIADRLGTRPALARLNTSPDADLTLSERTMMRLRERCADEFELYETIK